MNRIALTIAAAMVSPVLLVGPASASTTSATAATTEATATTQHVRPAAKLPKKKLTIKAPSKAKVKSKITIKTSGLAPGEAVSIGIGGQNMGDELYTGVASKKGKVSVKVKLPKFVTKGKWTITVYGSTLKRVGTKKITITK